MPCQLNKFLAGGPCEFVQADRGSGRSAADQHPHGRPPEGEAAQVLLLRQGAALGILLPKGNTY